MRTLNKKLSFIILSMLVIVLAACGAKNTGDDKVLRIGTEAMFAPFIFIDDGEVTGFDMDLIKAVAKEAGYEDVEIENTSWDSLLLGIKNKQYDLGIAGITINKERKKEYDFSTGYFESIAMIAFKEGVDVKSAEDLKGKKIGVQNGTTGMFTSEKVVGKDSPDIAKFESSSLMFQALQSDNVDVIVSDIAVVVEYLDGNKDAKLETVVDRDVFESEFYGIAFPKGSELQEKINTALHALFDNGEYAKIYQKWFNEEPDIEALKASN